ncbi:hypothetical protein GH733_015204, partial [Mirounga leonina]
MAPGDDKKLQFSLKKLGVSSICGVEDASLGANTFTITGQAETKLLTEMLPSMLNELGAESDQFKEDPLKLCPHDLWLEKHHLPLERRRRMKFQILWRILMRLPRMKQTELSQLLKKIKLEEVNWELL